jgi:hypothetical protein
VVSPQTTFALLLIVLVFARPPIVAAQNDLATLLQKVHTAVQIDEYRKSTENNTPLNPNAGQEKVDEILKGRREDAAIARDAKESRRGHQTKKEMAQVASNFMQDPNTYGNVMKLMTDPDARKLFQPFSQPEEDEGEWIGAPKVPVDCVAKGCGKCFLRAQLELDTVRRRFIRLQLTYRTGMGHMKALIAFGESARNMSPFAYMATRGQAKSLAEDADFVRVSYDKYYDELLKQLKTALEHIGECEDQAFGNDWYNRYGFVLYEAFALHYKRTD